jgi:hypothetical protein
MLVDLLRQASSTATIVTHMGRWLAGNLGQLLLMDSQRGFRMQVACRLVL